MDTEDKPYTAQHLLDHLDEFLLSEDAIAAIAEVMKERAVDMTTACFHAAPMPTMIRARGYRGSEIIEIDLDSFIDEWDRCGSFVSSD